MQKKARKHFHFHFLFFRQESIKQAEKERRIKYKKQDDEREVIRSALREKVTVNKHSFWKRPNCRFKRLFDKL